MKVAFNGRYIALGLLVYIIFLVLTFPADRAYAYLKPSDLSSSVTNQHFTLAGITGSVWSGKASVALINKSRFENLEWSYRPWSLLLGKVGFSWRFQAPGSQGRDYGQGVTALGLNGNVDFSSLEAQLPATFVASMVNLKALQPSGSLNLNLNNVKWTGESLASAEGRIVWRGAEINLLKPVELGDLTLTLETSNDEVRGVIKDSGGPLSAEGVVTLAEDGRYKVNGAFATRGNNPDSKELENALRSMGKPGADGKVKVTHSGTLSKLGLIPARSK